MKGGRCYEEGLRENLDVNYPVEVEVLGKFLAELRLARCMEVRK